MAPDEGKKLPLIIKGLLLAPKLNRLLPASKTWFEATVKAPFAVTSPLPEALEVAEPLPSPKVKLLKVQLPLPPKLPVPSTKNVPPVRLIVP